MTESLASADPPLAEASALQAATAAAQGAPGAASARSGRRARKRRAPAGAVDFTIITGLSGAGRSQAAKSLEDLGYFVVDNLPPALIGKMAELATAAGGPERVAIVADVRGGVFFGELSRGLEDLRRLGVPYRILFLEADEGILVNRYEASRRKHPLAPADRVVEGIRKERQMMQTLRGEADLVLDTSDLSPHEFRDRIRDTFGRSETERSLQVSLVSFGYKYGVPRDCDLIFDVRFLPNPYWIDDLRPLPGTDPRVKGYVTGQRKYGEFMRKLRALLDVTLPGYVEEGKSYLTVGVGCTGGRHRSVVVVDALAAYFGKKGFSATVDHRDIDRE
jgi:RNase adapter protein RapZ